MNSVDSQRPVLTIGDLVRHVPRTEKGELFVTDVTAGNGTVKYAVDGNAWFTREQLRLVTPCVTEEQLAACLERIDEIYEAEAHGDEEDEELFDD